MKILSKMKSKRVIASVCAVVILGGGSAVAAMNLNRPVVSNVDPIVSQSPAVVSDVEQTETLNETPAVSPSVKPTPSESPDVVEPAEKPTGVKSTQEYAEIYLNLVGMNQRCFDAIVAEWPERFTESVRESNVKALRVFSSTCATGILQSNKTGSIYNYGKNGEFFDSEAAERGRDS